MTAGLPGNDAADATPLSDEDFDGLIPTFVSTRNDLNVVEQANIEAAFLWSAKRRSGTRVPDLLTIKFADTLHRRMFGDVWRWAGRHRTRQTNIGVEPFQIVTEMKLLFDDAVFWHRHDTYEPTEAAVRLHHRLVRVHPYRNGNGRHARFFADLFLDALGQPPLTWGMHRALDVDGAARTAYIAGLRAADAGDVGPLLDFCAS
jgi:Fic-DOC domain mobile mystery protein B